MKFVVVVQRNCLIFPMWLLFVQQKARFYDSWSADKKHFNSLDFASHELKHCTCGLERIVMLHFGARTDKLIEKLSGKLLHLRYFCALNPNVLTVQKVRTTINICNNVAKWEAFGKEVEKWIQWHIPLFFALRKTKLCSRIDQSGKRCRRRETTFLWFMRNHRQFTPKK